MRVPVFVATIALTVSGCCGPLRDLPEVEFGAEVDRVSDGRQEEKARKAMSLEEAVGELRTFHEKVAGEVAEGLCVEEVAASFEVMTVKSRGGSVKLAVVPLSFRRGRERAATAGSTVTVTYRNPDCPPAVTPDGPAAGTPPEMEEVAPPGPEEETE